MPKANAMQMLENHMVVGVTFIACLIHCDTPCPAARLGETQTYLGDVTRDHALQFMAVITGFEN